MTSTLSDTAAAVDGACMAAAVLSKTLSSLSKIAVTSVATDSASSSAPETGASNEESAKDSATAEGPDSTEEPDSATAERADSTDDSGKVDAGDSAAAEETNQSRRGADITHSAREKSRSKQAFEAGWLHDIKNLKHAYHLLIPICLHSLTLAQ